MKPDQKTKQFWISETTINIINRRRKFKAFRDSARSLKSGNTNYFIRKLSETLSAAKRVKQKLPLVRTTYVNYTN